MSTDVRIWRIKSVPALKESNPHYASKHHFAFLISYTERFSNESFHWTILIFYFLFYFVLLLFQYGHILFNLSPNSYHFHPLQVENCYRDSRLVVDEDDNCKFRFGRVKTVIANVPNIIYDRQKSTISSIISINSRTHYSLDTSWKINNVCIF